VREGKYRFPMAGAGVGEGGIWRRGVFSWLEARYVTVLDPS